MKPDGGMKPKEAAQLLRVTTKTLVRWANNGQIHYIRTPGGHRRYSTDDINRLLHMPPDEDRLS